MKKATLALVLLAVTAAYTVEAQDTSPPEVASGDKVRLTRAGWGQERFTATVVEVQRDVLLIRTAPKRPTRSVSLAGLTKLEVARGSDRWQRVTLTTGGSARLGAAVVPIRRGLAARLAFSF